MRVSGAKWEQGLVSQPVWLWHAAVPVPAPVLEPAAHAPCAGCTEQGSGNGSSGNRVFS